MRLISQLLKNQISGKVFLVRVDINVPIFAGKILDNSRITKSFPTIEFILKNEGKVIIISHFGRPKGKFVEAMSIKQLISEFKHKFGDVTFIDDVKAPDFQEKITKTPFASLIICENIRFYPEETENNEEFAKNIAKSADFYVNEAFSCSHRAHASIVGFAKFLPSYAGFLLSNEVKNIENILKNQDKSNIIAIVGGSKVSTKIDLLYSLMQKVNCIVIGGGMANTFLFADNIQIGKSLCENNLASKAKEIIQKAKQLNCEIITPIDVKTSKTLENANISHNKTLDNIKQDDIIGDIGDDSIAYIAKKIATHSKVIWNGPLGIYEMAAFSQGTTKIAHKIADLTQANKIVSVAGGGAVVSALKNIGLIEKFSYISTAGGAFLEWLEGKELPGIKVLK